MTLKQIMHLHNIRMRAKDQREDVKNIYRMLIDVQRCGYKRGFTARETVDQMVAPHMVILESEGYILSWNRSEWKWKDCDTNEAVVHWLPTDWPHVIYPQVRFQDSKP